MMRKRGAHKKEKDLLISRCFPEAILTLELARVSGAGSVAVCLLLALPAMIRRYGNRGREGEQLGKKN